MESEPAEPEEAEPGSDFEIAADAAFGAQTPEEYRSALKEAIHACMSDYGPDTGKDSKAPAKDGLALIFGKE